MTEPTLTCPACRQVLAAPGSHAVADVFVQDRRMWARLREKGGKRHEMPCHHNLESYLHAYLDGGGIASDPTGALFRTIGRTQNSFAPSQRPRHDPPAGRRRRHQDQSRQSHLPSDGNHGVPEKWRLARKRRRHREPRLDPHHTALRSPARRDEPRRGGADFDLIAGGAPPGHEARRRKVTLPTPARKVGINLKRTHRLCYTWFGATLRSVESVRCQPLWLYRKSKGEDLLRFTNVRKRRQG
jgi:hypothetical protein